MNRIEILEVLINSFSKLPGVGKKTAEKYAYSVIGMESEDVRDFSESLVKVKENIKFCDNCGNWTSDDVCSICKSRSSEILYVVEQPKDVLIFEKIKKNEGVYHVLHGALSPLKNIGPDDLNIKKLIERVGDGKYIEVILATSTSVEGEATAHYLAKILSHLGVKVSRIAQGISIGSSLEYVDEVSLARAIDDRKILN